jgi:hypothetical protein
VDFVVLRPSKKGRYIHRTKSYIELGPCPRYIYIYRKGDKYSVKIMSKLTSMKEDPSLISLDLGDEEK